MRIRLVLLLAIAFLVAISLPARAGVQEHGGEQHGGEQHGGDQHGGEQHPAPHGTPPKASPPRANEGHVPPPPQARDNHAAPREPEHTPAGHTNDTPHVNHNTWYGHEPANDARFHLDHPYPHGHFAHFGPTYRYRVLRIDTGRHMFWFPGGFYFQIADWDWALAADWCWNCGDDFIVYEDPDHPGWYLVYNVQTGAYIHAQYMGG